VECGKNLFPSAQPQWWKVTLLRPLRYFHGCKVGVDDLVLKFRVANISSWCGLANQWLVLEHPDAYAGFLFR
jgi:hypothetical protein